MMKSKKKVVKVKPAKKVATVKRRKVVSVKPAKKVVSVKKTTGTKKVSVKKHAKSLSVSRKVQTAHGWKMAKLKKKK